MSNSNLIYIRNPEESQLCSGLYLVPTPIGNLRDITLRSLDVLRACDVIVCEDSRVTGKLLKAYALSVAKKIVYNDHADDAVKAYILSLIDAGNIVAFVSDAGTPLISDPGYKLVRDCLAKGLYVTALPGANAVLPALQLSGLPSDRFVFCGFLPSKDKAASNLLHHYKSATETLIFYDSPNRIVKNIGIILDVLGNRHIAICREISKLYEETITGQASDVLAKIQETPPRGEIVIVIEGAGEMVAKDDDIDALIQLAMEDGQSIKELSAEISAKTGMKKKDVYNRALDLRQD